MLKLGSQAPDFKAPLVRGGEFHLGSFHEQNPVVLFFFPKAFTSGRTIEARSFRDTKEAIEKTGTNLLGISPDPPSKLERFGNSNNLQFGLVADTEKMLVRLYDARRRFGLGVSRVTYVIDKSGCIAGAFHHEANINQHVTDVLDSINSLSS